MSLALLLLPVLVLMLVVALEASWEELASKSECGSQWCGLWSVSVGLGPNHGAFAGRFTCSSHSVAGAAGVVGEGVAVSLAGVFAGRLLEVEVVEGGEVVVGVWVVVVVGAGVVGGGEVVVVVFVVVFLVIGVEAEGEGVAVLWLLSLPWFLMQCAEGDACCCVSVLGAFVLFFLFLLLLLLFLFSVVEGVGDTLIGGALFLCRRLKRPLRWSRSLAIWSLRRFCATVV